ncbi:hypothetical protein V6N12_054021 [Hibiscus sabdariffa]|uniref:Uncharacterized protein n=1 Tax=Hibiscus sabdariffa TaxID=183260 RepID=A0ABR2DA53_9ROSI
MYCRSGQLGNHPESSLGSESSFDFAACCSVTSQGLDGEISVCASYRESCCRLLSVDVFECVKFTDPLDLVVTMLLEDHDAEIVG